MVVVVVEDQMALVDPAQQIKDMMVAMVVMVDLLTTPVVVEAVLAVLVPIDLVIMVELVVMVCRSPLQELT